MNLGFPESAILALLTLASWVVVPLVFYWITRLAVRHGVRDARRDELTR